MLLLLYMLVYLSPPPLFISVIPVATSSIHPLSGGYLSGSAARLQISGKMTSPDGLKPAPIKKSPFTRDKFNQFVEEKGTGPSNPRSTVPTKSNAAASNTVLQIVEGFSEAFQRVSNRK